MRRLLATTCLASIPAALIAPAAGAQTVASISSAQSTPVSTSTANSGSAADVSITSAGSITTTSPTAVTIDSNNNVTNAGTISITDVNSSTGVYANPGVTGGISNSGTITVTETYTQTDTNGDGVLDGAFAQGTNRFGIRTFGASTGDIVNSGSITVHGNSSGGIVIGGPLTGSINQTGTIGIQGDNSTGLYANTVSGNVTIGGTISATGQNSAAAVLNGDIGGALLVNGTLTSTGYTSTTLPTTTTSLTAGNLLQGGPTLSIAGNVAGGVNIAGATTITNSDGTTTSVAAGSLTSFGSANALQIGSTRAIRLGAIASDVNGFGLDVNGSVQASSVYDGVTARAIQIGGMGGTVTVAGGMGVGATVSATSNDASSTAIEFGSGATIPTLNVGASVSATGATKAGDVSTAILIDSGASLPSIVNSGSIVGTVSGSAATANGIVDRSGTLGQILNSGTISGTTNAIDLSANTSGATVTQTANTGTTAPAISGAILFGSGNDTLSASAGTIKSAVSFGGGTNALALSGTAAFTGSADYAGNAGTLAISGTGSFSGTLTNAGRLAATINGGTLSLTGTGATTLGSLSVSNGTLGITVDGTTGASTLYQVAGTASFGTGSTLAVHVSDLGHAAGTYQVVSASTLSGAGNLSTSATLPFLFNSAVSTNAANTGVFVTVSRKTAADLGLNRAESVAYEPIIAAATGDKPIGDSFLNFGDAASVKQGIRSLMPNFSGSVFDTVSSASRATARILADPDAPLAQVGHFGFWLQQTTWMHTKPIDDTAGYKLSGWGLTGGAEYETGPLGRVGVSLSYFAGDDKTTGTENQIDSNEFEFAGYWRADYGNLHLYARGAYGTVKLKSFARFLGNDNGTQLVRTANARWNGKVIDGTAGLSYRLNLDRFSIRPQGWVDYYRLKEDPYAQVGGGTGMNLTIDARTSREFAANESVALGYAIVRGTEQDDKAYARIELEGGRRQILSGSLGATTAQFTGGNAFTLTPDPRTGGWNGAVRLKGGNGAFTVAGEVDGQREEGSTAFAARVGVQVGF